MKNNAKFKFVIDESHEITNDDLCRSVMGMNINELVRDIQLNLGGKYDKF